MAKSVLGKVKVTAKQKSARRKNIAIARKAKKKGAKTRSKRRKFLSSIADANPFTKKGRGHISKMEKKFKMNAPW